MRGMRVIHVFIVLLEFSLQRTATGSLSGSLTQDVETLCQLYGKQKKIENWALEVTSNQKSYFSQGGQDGSLEYIYSKIGTRNKYFVEFGFNTQSYEDPLSTGSNTRNLWERHSWSGLLLDSSFENATINLHREFITSQNVVSLFSKYGVPRDVDYVSIDIDSADLWVFRAIVSSEQYRPRVLTVEYNGVFPVQSTITCYEDCRWRNGDRLYGASLGALIMVAEEYGYALVDVIHSLDAVFVRRDELYGSLTPSRKFWEKWPICVVHYPVTNRTRLYSGELVDYAVWTRTGSPSAQATASAAAQIANFDLEYLLVNTAERVKEIIAQHGSNEEIIEESDYSDRKTAASRLNIPILGVARGSWAGLVDREEKGEL